MTGLKTQLLAQFDKSEALKQQFIQNFDST
jgi:hypothetical protein